MTRRDLVSGLGLLFAHVGGRRTCTMCTVVKSGGRFPVGTWKKPDCSFSRSPIRSGPTCEWLRPHRKKHPHGGARSKREFSRGPCLPDPELGPFLFGHRERVIGLSAARREPRRYSTMPSL